MKTVWLGIALWVSADVAFADTECTRADRSAWQDESRFRQTMKAQGIRITKFRVTPGNCYEIYGFDSRRQKVEHYHDPVTGRLVLAEDVVQR